MPHAGLDGAPAVEAVHGDFGDGVAPRVAVIFTGDHLDARGPDRGRQLRRSAGGLARTPGLDAIAEVESIDLGRTPASHFTFEGLFEIAGAIRSAQADPAIDGVVLVQGTDVIEETAFCWDLVLADETPVVVTGAMRSASEPDDDGPANLRDAVRCAADAQLRGEGVVVVLAGSIDAADDVTKTHATVLDTSGASTTGPSGASGREGSGSRGGAARGGTSQRPRPQPGSG
jgi:L-asparaginase